MPDPELDALICQVREQLGTAAVFQANVAASAATRDDVARDDWLRLWQRAFADELRRLLRPARRGGVPHAEG